MARGSIVWRCPICGNRASEKCEHAGGRYSIAYYTTTFDPVLRRIVKKRKWETAPLNEKHKPTKELAEKLLAKRLYSVHENTYRELKDITFADFADKWLKTYARGQVKRKTYAAYDSYIRVHLTPALGALALQAITKEIIQELVAATLAAGAALKSVKNHVVPLKGMLASAVEDGYLVVSPASKVKLAKVKGKKVEHLSPEEVLHLLDGIHEDGKPFIKAGWYVPIKLAIFSGLRQGEQFALRIGDLDFHNGQVRVERNLTWDDKRQAVGEVRYHFDTPKTEGSIRNVDLPPDLLEDLRRYVAGLPDQDPERLLFSTGAGTPLDPKNVVDRVFSPAVSRAGLRHVSWHALRHTYASLQLESGANIKYLSQQMGHADASITLNRYTHLLKSSHPAQAAKLSVLVFGNDSAEQQSRAVADPWEASFSGHAADRSVRDPGQYGAHDLPRRAFCAASASRRR